jgi:hypothetical protein
MPTKFQYVTEFLANSGHAGPLTMRRMMPISGIKMGNGHFYLAALCGIKAGVRWTDSPGKPTEALQDR